MDEPITAADEFSPYVGLQPYSEADREYFFGRERDSRIISSNLYAAPLTIFYGASGVGKSSVLSAGVYPHLLASPRTAVVIFDGWADQNLLYALKTKCLEAIAQTTESRNVRLDFSFLFRKLCIFIWKTLYFYYYRKMIALVITWRARS